MSSSTVVTALQDVFDSADFYRGAQIPIAFQERWQSQEHTGVNRPFTKVRIRRGKMLRDYHTNWPDPQFGRIYGNDIHYQWYPTWTPQGGWIELDSVYSTQLAQSFDQNGVTTLTLQCDNVQWQRKNGVEGDHYYQRDRGYLWPWRGWTPPNAPGGGGSGDFKNEWYRRLPNAQIEISQGYGSDVLIKTFTGLIDNVSMNGSPDICTITARDFGGILSDCDIFGWNKTRDIMDPILFVPADHKAKDEPENRKRWVIINDVSEIVECCLRWAGFKDWQVESTGVSLEQTYPVAKSNTYMDVINEVATQTGYVFFMGEPDPENDLSIGTPIFRKSQAIVAYPRTATNMIALHGRRMLTNFQPVHDNTSDRYVIRVRGQVASRKKGGAPLYGDQLNRYFFTYWPPWMSWMAGVIKQLTYYNSGSDGTGTSSILGFTSDQQCAVACLLIAMQIALARDTATGTTLGHPGIGLDSYVYVTDEANGIASRLYITNRTSTMQIGGSGSSTVSSSASAEDPIWSTDFGGSLTDNPEWVQIREDYVNALNNALTEPWTNPSNLDTA